MTAEEVFCELYDKYSVDFNWHLLPLLQANGSFVEELKREIGNDHFLSHKKIWAVAKCDSNDDVLYVTGNELGTDTYYIFHLTYSAHNSAGFPKYEEFPDIYAMKKFIEQSFVKNYKFTGAYL